MNVRDLQEVVLPDPDGARHRLGDFWAHRPTLLVFARHFGCLHCRAHAAELREHYDEARQLDAEIVAIGTGNTDYARDFVERDRIPYPVLVDDDARAARAASVHSANLLQLFHPASYAGTWSAWRSGFRSGWPGKRVTQLGATFVLGPGPIVLYAHYDAHPADHAPITKVLAILRRA